MSIQKLTFIVSLLLVTANVFGQQENLNQNFKKLEWLTGTWNRVNIKPGQAGSENWTKTSANKLAGKGVTLKGTDTVFVEKLELIIKDNAIFYVADVTGQAPTYFKLTAITADGFVCENPEHDFPKKISYKLTGNKLKATISGDGKSMNYDFVRKE